MSKKTLLIPFAVLGLSACQLTMTTDQQKAQAACAEVENPSRCFEIAYQDLRDVRMQKRALSGTNIVLSPSPPVRGDAADDNAPN